MNDRDRLELKRNICEAKTRNSRRLWVRKLLSVQRQNYSNFVYAVLKVRCIFLDSSMAEHSAVNRRVVGSSPTRGAQVNILWISADSRGGLWGR